MNPVCTYYPHKERIEDLEHRLKLTREMLENLKDTLVSLHGTQTAEVKIYYRAIEGGCNPEEAWLVFARTTQEVDVWQELEDVDTLLENLS